MTARSLADVAVRGIRPRRRARRLHLPRSAALTTALTLFGICLLLAVIGPAVLVDPNRQDLNAAYSPPGTTGHPLGTDPLGRDVLSWTLSSVRVSALVAVTVVLVAMVVGVAVGMLAAYFGGVLDAILMRLVDLQLALPPLLLFIAAAAVVGRSITMLIVLLCIPSWVPYARVVRTRVLVERERPSIAAARLAGAGHVRILLRDLLPATRGIVVVLASLQLGWILLWEAALSFIALGVRPPDTSLGYMIAQGRDSLTDAWWVVAFPGLMLIVLVLASNLLGDGLRDTFDVDEEVVDR